MKKKPKLIESKVVFNNLHIESNQNTRIVKDEEERSYVQDYFRKHRHRALLNTKKKQNKTKHTKIANRMKKKIFEISIF